MPPFAIAKFNSTKPRDRGEVDLLLTAITERAVDGLNKLEMRLLHSDAMRRAGRLPLADAIKRTACAEWRIAGLALLEDLRKYSESYGYAVGPEFTRSCREIEASIAGFDPTAPAAPQSGGASFDPAEYTGRGVEASLDRFYDAHPSLEEYLKCKRWIAGRSAQFLLRQPRSDAEQRLRFWSPLVMRSGAASPLALRDVFASADAGDKLIAQWRRVLWATETADPADLSLARAVLIELAASQRAEATAAEPYSPKALAHAMNAVGAMGLAAMMDVQLPPGFGPAQLRSVRARIGRAGAQQLHLLPPGFGGAEHDRHQRPARAGAVDRACGAGHPRPVSPAPLLLDRVCAAGG